MSLHAPHPKALCADPLTEIPIVLNIEPHYLKLLFDVPYEDITVQDVLEKANQSLKEYGEAHRVKFLHWINDPVRTLPTLDRRLLPNSSTARIWGSTLTVPRRLQLRTF